MANDRKKRWEMLESETPSPTGPSVEAGVSEVAVVSEVPLTKRQLSGTPMEGADEEDVAHLLSDEDDGSSPEERAEGNGAISGGSAKPMGVSL
jgi:hypothetical protein